MKPNDQKELLNEILPDENFADFREASLARGLASLRTQRRRRALVRAGALVAIACACVYGLLPKNPQRAHQSIAAVSTPAPVSVADHVKFISDDELLAMFPQGSVALIGKPTQQRLVFLNQTHEVQ